MLFKYNLMDDAIMIRIWDHRHLICRVKYLTKVYIPVEEPN
jgi:hypothetical protein